MTTPCRSNSLNPPILSSGGWSTEESVSLEVRSTLGTRRFTAAGLEHGDTLPNIGVSLPQLPVPKKSLVAPATPNRSQPASSFTNILADMPFAAPSPTPSLQADVWNSAQCRGQQGKPRSLTGPRVLNHKSFSSNGSSRGHTPRGTLVESQQIQHDTRQHHTRRCSTGNSCSTGCGSSISHPSSSSGATRTAAASTNNSMPPVESAEDWHRHRSEEADTEFGEVIRDPKSCKKRELYQTYEIFQIPNVDYPTDVHPAYAEHAFTCDVMNRQLSATSATSTVPELGRAERVSQKLSSTDDCGFSEEDSDEEAKEEKQIETAAVGTTRMQLLQPLQQACRSVIAEVSVLKKLKRRRGRRASLSHLVRDDGAHEEQ
eukprot:gnl/TRDRNA2_/TRDRNA2_167894_c0_seq1.p1 gnl/TRDRNA2_/TRDRNA2_167894_c0~~gnl/TRDRNA2_/TRDRNA2_167894_c0_seq1.p1  ORF type:complete len:373 (+),score=36.26 gnl/TRDRNA2_/TRDRNA2_167894_c0_seq1:92-1210(+)